MSTTKILVIEDNEESRQIVKDVLEANGFEVETAADGEIGLNKIRFSVKQKIPFDLCITDVMLPKVSGIDLLKRAHEISPDTGVIVISAFDEVDPFIKKDAIRSGAFSFLSKPIEPAKLLRCVNEFFSGKKLRKTTGAASEGAVPFFGTVPSQRRKTDTFTREMGEAPMPAELEKEEPGQEEEAAPPPPPPVDEEHITRPVPDAEHFKDISDTDELEENEDYPFAITKCPMCSHMIKIAKDGVSGKIWCSNCGILFDKEDSELVDESAPPQEDKTEAGTQAEKTEEEDFLEMAEVEDENIPPLDLQEEDEDGSGFDDVDKEGDLTEVHETLVPETGGTGKQGLKLLVVEDDQHAAEILETALDVAGYPTDTADTGQKAFDMIMESIKTADPYDLVICDVMIPEINGLDLMIKVNETRSGIDFILVSAYEDENLSLQKQAEEEGALTFFSKPYDYKELISFISKYARE